ncbi:hypothetical protein [Luteolibacter sp. Populi]|uniref:hypothetical protein n=1 Tax=Luteolibacter sp. Populi TaxID=3230487 RepID=UPI0034650BE0
MSLPLLPEQKSVAPMSPVQLNPKPPLDAEQCFLSEFDFPGLRWCTRKSGAEYWLGGISFLWAVVVLWLGDQVGANALSIVFKATATTSKGLDVSATLPIVYGHLATANAGPFYLFVGPVLIILAFRFHRAAGRAFAKLHERGVLKVNGGEPWEETIARRNRRAGSSCYVFFLVLLLICPAVQFASLSRSAQGLPELSLKDGLVTVENVRHLRDTGFIQSPNHDLWVGDFNRAEPAAKLFVMEQHDVVAPLELALAAELERRDRTIAAMDKVCDFKQGVPSKVRFADAIRFPKILHLEAINVWPHAKSGFLIQGRGSADQVQRDRYLRWFKVFVLLDQVRVAAFFAFMGWLVVKFGFYLGQLYVMLPGKERAQGALRLEPWLHDSHGKFGMGELFLPYNLLVLIVAVGSSALALNLPDGASLDSLTKATGAGSGSTRTAHIIVIFLSIGMVLAGPLCLYPRKLAQWAESASLRHLRQRQANASRKEKNSIFKEEAEILGQTTWPKGDNYFRITILLVFAILLLPLGSAYDFVPSAVSRYSRTPQYLRAECKRFAAYFYDLDLTGATSVK